MDKIELLKEHRGGSNSTSYTGRSEGKLVREKLDLNTIDLSVQKYFVTIPEDTTSFNPSFYLGLFYDSIKKLSWEGFKEKYIFDLSNLPSSLQPIILRNLEECERKAKNELCGLTGLDL